jgi:hypothetical protein
MKMKKKREITINNIFEQVEIQQKNFLVWANFMVIIFLLSSFAN